jgi:hypothetical protein
MTGTEKVRAHGARQLAERMLAGPERSTPHGVVD